MTVREIRRAIDEAIHIVRSGDYDPTILNVRTHGNLTLLNYTDKASYRGMWTPWLRVCRGLVIDSENNLVSLPLVKFFNLNEHDETSPAHLADKTVRCVCEKADGVMIQVFHHEGELVFASRHGIWTRAAVIASQLAGGCIQLPEGYTMVAELLHNEVWQPGMCTPPAQPALVILYLRDLSTLELIPAVEFYSHLEPPLRLPQQYPVYSIDEAVQLVEMAEHADWEGVVVQYTHGYGNLLVKLKSPEYLKRLASVRGMTTNRMLRTYLEGGLEALRATVAEVEEFLVYLPHVQELIARIESLERQVTEQAQRYAGLGRARVLDIPPPWRWTVSYTGDKFNRSIRKIVVREMENSGWAHT
ncbi:MAG: hypothetical protein KatS3mg023_3761 [Armatimonadota bacterium]|nr:MAG: hypothetical protein KatS3mg023_3761 [Armatimonadota bacterium]